MKERILTSKSKKQEEEEKKKENKTVPVHPPLTPLLSAGLIAEEASGNSLYSNKWSPWNYHLSAPSTAYEEPLPEHYAHYIYNPMTSASATAYSPAQHQMYAGEGKQQQKKHILKDSAYKLPNGMVEIKPSLTATTTAALPHYVANTGTGHQLTHAESSMDTNPTDMYHTSTNTCFSPFASNHSSSLMQSLSQKATTNSLSL